MTLVMLSCFLGDRWARDRLTADEACRATLTRDQLHAITGRGQLVYARKALRSLGEHVSFTIRTLGVFTEIHWPKFAEYQELPSRGREFKARRKPESAPAPSPSPAQSQAHKNSTVDPAPAKPTRKSSPRILPDWALANARLLAEFSAKSPGGLTVTDSQVRTWARDIEKLVGGVMELNVLIDPGPMLETVIRWLYSDQNSGEYAFVVRSGAALRKKWPDIHSAAQRQHEHSPAAKQARSDAVYERLKDHKGATG